VHNAGPAMWRHTLTLVATMKHKKKIIIITGAITSVLLCGYIAFANILVSDYGKYCTDDIDRIESCYAGLLLGTSKKLSDGRDNLFYKYRIDAAERLYKTGKLKKIVVSGDNSRDSYNEPQDMKNDLVNRGISESDIVCDYAGFRTLDSIIRFNQIFCQTSGIVISQEFHTIRAVYIARRKGISLVGYNAKDVDAYNGFKTKARELLSKAFCVLDVEIFGTNPKYLGEKISI
jgi:SanA protein